MLFRSSNEIQFILYNLPNEDGKVQVVIRDETLWCTQKAMAQLFGVGVPAINKHLKNIYESGELLKDATISKMETVVNRGFRGDVNELIDFYSLDERENTFSMEQFSNSVNKFLVFLDYKILPDKGHISAAQAKAKAEGEYEIFNRTQVIDSDFDKQIREIQKKGK